VISREFERGMREAGEKERFREAKEQSIGLQSE
jgi:hypothetical protein